MNYKITDRLLKLSVPTRRSDKYEQSRSLMTLSRDLHEKAWISLGIFKQDKMIKYEHSDAGLSFTNVKIKKLRTFQELWEKNEEIKKKSDEHQGFRNFREYQDIEEEDVIVTIEYCTNCHEHMGSTKHDETKYLTYAQSMRNEIIARFPICKVILKPLIYDHLDHSIDTMFLQRRLGCFEVQVISKQKGQIKYAVIGSKLATKQWPSIPVIINKLPPYFKKVSFNVEFKFAASDQILKNIHVKVQPHRPKQQSSTRAKTNPISNSQSMFLHSQERSNHHLRPQSTNQTRPKSAISAVSVQSQRSTNEHLDMCRVETTNAEGKICLKNIPLDTYEFIVDETNDFLSRNQVIDFFKLVDTNQRLDQTIELRKQTHSCIQVSVVFDKIMPISEAKVELVPLRGGKEALLKESPSGSGKYEIVVEPDKFKLFVKRSGYFVHEEQISTRAGVCEFKIEIKKAPEDQGYDPVQDALEKKLSIKPSTDLKVKKPKFLVPPSENYEKINLIQFQFIDLVSKKPVQSVYIRVFDEQHNKLYSYRSNENGICKALLEQKITKGKIIIQHNEYYHETKMIDEQNVLSVNKTNIYYIIQKPNQGQLTILIVNKQGYKFLNCYILLENKQVIQQDQDIKQYQNEQDGIQYVKFHFDKQKDILQLFACLPDLKQMQQIQELLILTPNTMSKCDLPQYTEESAFGPYFWMLGSLKEPYETFDLVNQIIQCSQLKTYPTLTKSNSDIQVIQSAFQSPNIMVAANQNRSISFWNLDNYMIETTIPVVLKDQIQELVIWDDDNVVALDCAGNISWLRRDDNSQYNVGAILSINKPTTCMCKVGVDGLSVGCQDGSLVLIAVKCDLNQVSIHLDSMTEGVETINKMIAINNDQIAVLYDQEKKLIIFKVEKSLDKPLSLSVIKQIPLKGYVSGGVPILYIVSLEQRYLILGGVDGVLHTISIDNLEKGPNISFQSDKTVTSVLQAEDSLIILQGQSVTLIQQPETLAELRNHYQTYFESPVPLYGGDCQSYEKRLLTFNNKGKMLSWAITHQQFPPLSQFLTDHEFPRKLRPSESIIILVEGKIPKENFQLQLVLEDGSLILQSDQNTVRYYDEERGEGYFYMEIKNKNQQGLWRVCAHMQNTELIKSQAPKIYYISASGFQKINFPNQIPLSRKQVYNWLIGTLIPQVDSFKTTTFYTDQSIVGKFPSLESTKHQGKINQLVLYNKDEFITAGEDKQIILWDANTFKINKIFIHEAEVLSIYVHHGIIFAGNKDGQVNAWKKHDSIWQLDHQFKFHEKAVHSITVVESSIVTASEDRKIHLVNINSGALEHAEPVDRTFVISLQAYNKDCFAAGFPDGRVKTYKREKSNNKVFLKILRTTGTVKCQHTLLIQQPLLFVGGMDKVSDILNLDSGIKLKTLKEGHQGAVLCSLQYQKYLITGGSDGRLNIWNIEKGQSVKTIELIKEEIRGMMVVNRLLITASSNGVLRVWQEICPFIEQIPEEKEEEPIQQQ